MAYAFRIFDQNFDMILTEFYSPKNVSVFGEYKNVISVMLQKKS